MYIQLLQQLIATPRTSRNEAAAADMLSAWLTRQGISHNRHNNNIWTIAPNYQPDRPTLLLNAHIDTVKPATTWQRDPFQPTLEGDTLYGLGANDDGASLVALLAVFRQLTTHAQPYNLIWLASAEEEVSGSNGIRSVLPLLPHIDVALVGEPTGMQPAIAEKGLIVIDCTTHGRAGHAARDEGDNAIYHAMEDINWIRNYRFPRHSTLLGDVRTTVTIINAGTQHNVIPDICHYTIDVRTNECYTNTEIIDIIRQHINADLKPRSTHLNSSSIPQTHPLVQRAIALGRTPFGSPTLSDQALMPFPSLKMGPGQSQRSHTADEFIRISEINLAITDYITMLDGCDLSRAV